MKKLFLLSFVIVFSVIFAFGQDWQIVKQGTADILPGACFFLNANTGWIIADEGFVKKTTDGGTTWTKLRDADPATTNWNDVEFVDANVGFACGNLGYIYKTTDGGTNWTMIADTANYDLDVVSLAIVNATTVYFACDDGLVLKTTNGGTTITPASAAVLTTEDLNGGIDFIDATHGVVATSANVGETWYTTDGGATWTNVNIAVLFPPGTSSKRLYDVAAGPGNTIVIAGYHSTIFISKDGGQTYSRSGDFSYGYNYAKLARIVDQNTIYIARSIGDLVKTTDGGATWDTLSIGSAQTPSDMSFPTASAGYVFSAYGQWAKTADGGATWTPLNEWPSMSLWGIAFPEPDKIVVSAYAGGEISISTDGGDSWTYPDNYATESLTNLYECEFADANLGFVGGGYGDLRRTTDGGATWTFIENPMFLGSNKHINAMRVWDANTIFAGGSSGYVMRSTDGGLTWSDTKVGTQTVYDIWAVSATSVIVSAGSGQVHTGEFTAPDAVTATQINDWGSQSMRAVKFRGNIGLVVASSGEVYRTTDGTAASLALVYTVSDGDDLYDVDFVDDNLVYAVGEAGTIIKSEDAGATWTELTGPTDATLDKVRYDGETVWALGNGGTILKLEFLPMVTFQVNMSAQIERGKFIVGTDVLDVAGTINNWGETINLLSDDDADGIYTATLPIAEGAIEYKFRINSNWDTAEAVSNRTYTVVPGDNVIPVVWYSNFDPASVVNAEVFFFADMNIQLLNGNFRPADGDIAIVRGALNGWAGEAQELTEDPSKAGLYVGAFDVDDLSLDVPSEFKFVVHSTDGSDKWESSPNRIFVIPTGHSYVDSDADGYIEVPTDTAFFADVTWDDIIQQDVTVYFSVDISSAIAALNAGQVLIDSQTDADTIRAASEIAGVFVNGIKGSWWDWGSNPPTFMMHDDGTNGDETAGDNIYTLGLLFTAGQAKVQTYKYGINSLDNEAGFGENRNMTIDDAASTYYPTANCYGSQTTDDRLPFPEYGCESSAIFGENTLLPEQFDLYQNYPNPFNPTTSIAFAMPQADKVALEIYNILGEKVRTLYSGNLDAGLHVYEWNARNDAGQIMPTGIYIYKLNAGSLSMQKKMVMMK